MSRRLDGGDPVAEAPAPPVPERMLVGRPKDAL